MDTDKEGKKKGESVLWTKWQLAYEAMNKKDRTREL